MGLEEMLLCCRDYKSSGSQYVKKYVNPHKLEKKLQTLSKDSKLKKETVKQLLFYFSHVTRTTGGRMPRSQFRQEMTNQ